MDLLQRLFGEIVAVRCHTGNVAGHQGIEDVAMATLRHRGGHSTSLTSVWHGVTTRQSSRHLEVFTADQRLETHQDYFGSLRLEWGDEPVVTLSRDEVLTCFMAAEGLPGRRPAGAGGAVRQALPAGGGRR